MEQPRKVDVEPAAKDPEQHIRETREYLETVSAERETTVPPAQDQSSHADADTLDDGVPGAPD